MPDIYQVYARYILFELSFTRYKQSVYFFELPCTRCMALYARYILGIYLVTVYQHIADRSCDGPAVMFSVLVTGSAVHIGVYW